MFYAGTFQLEIISAMLQAHLLMHYANFDYEKYAEIFGVFNVFLQHSISNIQLLNVSAKIPDFIWDSKQEVVQDSCWCWAPRAMPPCSLCS